MSGVNQHRGRPQFCLSTAVLRPLLFLVGMTTGALCCSSAQAGNYNGAVGLSYRYDESSEGARNTEFGRNLQLGVNSYIWQPWFATYSGSAFVSWIENDASGNLESDTTLEAGNLDLMVFPVSRFPFRGFWERLDTRIDNQSVASESSDQRRVERIGFTQNYRPFRGQYSLAAGFTRTDTDELEAGQDNSQSDLWFFRGRTRLAQRHDLSARLDLDSVKTDISQVDRQAAIFNAEHSVSTRNNFSVENFVTVTDITDDTAGVDQDSQLFRFNNEVTWDAPDRRSRWRSTIDVQDASDRLQQSETERRQFEIRQSGNYRLTEFVNLSGSLGYSERDQDGTDFTLISTNGTLSYSPESIPIAQGSYNWSTSGSVSYSDPSSGESSSTVGLGLGHGISWVEPVTWWGFNQLIVGSSQNLSLSESDTGTSSGSVTTSVNSSLQALEVDRTTVISSIFSDVHEFKGEEDSFQVLTADIQHVRTLDRFRTWNFSYAVNLTRQKLLGQETSAETASASFNYANSRLMDVRGLTFRSELEASADSVNALGTTEEGVKDRLWRNILEYTLLIGLLEFRATASNVITEDDQNYVLFVSARRSFGGSF